MRPGYKQTEVGVLPADWEVVSVGLRLRRTPSYGINAPAISFDSRFPTYLRITDITEDRRFAEATKASVEHPAATSYLLEPGDIVFARTGASVGKSYLYNPNDGDLVFAGFLIRLSPDPERLIPAFLSFYVQSHPYWNWVKVSSMRSGQPGINGREYASLPIPFPPTKAEQEAIAGALSDAEALIESLEQLLTKKFQLKQGVMQELLSGKKRLPGFRNSGLIRTEAGQLPSDWRVVPIGLIAQVKTGPFGSSLHESDYVDNGIPIITVEHLSEFGIMHSNLPMVSEADRRRLNAYSLQQGDVVFSRVGSIDRNSLVTAAEEGWLFSGRLMRLRASPRVVDTRYLSYHFHSEPFKLRIRAVAVGQTMPSLNTQILRNALVSLPSLPEQTAIADILTTLDAEIALLESKLAKARQIKQGMMQELLTGRIRLV